MMKKEYLNSEETRKKYIDVYENRPENRSTPTFNIISDVTEYSNLRFVNNFIDGAFLEILADGSGGSFEVLFKDKKTNKVLNKHILSVNHWFKSHIKYFVEWEIEVRDLSTGKIVYEYSLNLEKQKVYVALESSSLGDTIAWMPQIEAFRKLHNCEMVVSTFKNFLFEGLYPNITFIAPSTVVHNIKAMYKIGWFYKDEQYNSSMNPVDFKKYPLQKTASDILGLDYVQLNSPIKPNKNKRLIKEPYVCIAIHSTAQAKYWNNEKGWQEVVDYLNKSGYKVILLSKENDTYMGNNHPIGIIKGSESLTNTISYLTHAALFIGISSGLSWLAWGVGTPMVLISGFTEPFTEFEGDNIKRVFNPNVCNGCFNKFRLDSGDWNWCPVNKNTPKQYECTKTITGADVITKIKELI